MNLSVSDVDSLWASSQQAIDDEDPYAKYRWLGLFEQATESPWRELGSTAVALSILLLLVTGVVSIWNRALRSQVEKRTAELHQQQQQLIQADKMASLGVLVSGVAHEINNPTGLLLLNLPLVTDVWREAQPLLEQHYHQQGEFILGGLPYSRVRGELPTILEEMMVSANRIKFIVEDLKDFARHDAMADDEPTNINAVVAAAIRLVDASIRRATHLFLVHYDPQVPVIYANPRRIEQIVINLIVNACQALTNLGQKIEVVTAYHKPSNRVLVKVIDEGCGIETADINRLTDPFFTTKREYGGTGLGLSVSAGIAKAYGGRLLFSSEVGRGTEATLELPITAAEP